MAVDLSLRSTGISPEAVRESPVNRSGALYGQTMATASNLSANAMETQARGIYAQANAAESFGNAATNIGEVATNAIIGHQKAQLNKELNADMQAWINAKKNPDEIKLGLVQANELENLQPSMWDALGKGDIGSGAFADSINAFSSEAQALRAAHDQGMLQPSEFVTRLKSTIRKHAAANPGLAEELYQDGMKTLQMSGVMDLQDARVQEDKAAIKRQELLEKNLLSEMNKYGVQYNPYTFEHNQDELWNEVNRKRGIASTVGDYESGDKMYKLTTATEVNAFWRGDAPKLAENHTSQFSMGVSSILNSDLSPDQQLLAIDGLIRDSSQVMEQLFQTKGVAADPNAAKYREAFQSYATATREQIGNATTQSEKIKILENRNKVIEELSKSKLYEELDPATIQLINNLPIPMMESVLLKMNTPGGIGDTLLNKFAKVISDGLRSTSNTKAFFTEEGASEPKIGNGAATMMQLNKLGQMDALDKVIEAYDEAQGKATLSEAEQFNNMDDFAKISARPENLKQMQELSEESKGRMQRITANYMVLLGKSLDGLITQNSMLTGPGEFRSGSFTVKELPNGGILFESDNSTFEAKLNQEFARRYNNLVKVSSKLFNLPEKTVGEGYKAIFDNTFSFGSVGRVGLEGSVSDDIDMKIIGVESGGKASAKNPASTATGLGQFLEGTWKDVMKTHFPERIKGLSEPEILELRKDPNLARQAVTAYRGDLQKALRKAELPITDTTVYLTYFLGPGDGVKLLKTNPNTPVKNILKPEVINSNPPLQKGATVRDVVMWANNKMGV